MTAPTEGTSRSIIPPSVLGALCGPDITPWRLGLGFRAFGLVAAVLSTIDAVRIWGDPWDCTLLPIYGTLAYGLLFLLRPRWGFQMFAAVTVFVGATFAPPYFYPLEIFTPVIHRPTHGWALLFPVFPGCEFVAALVIAFTALQNSLRGGTALYGLAGLPTSVGAGGRRARRVVGVCLWLSSVAIIVIALLQWMAPSLWAANIGGPGGHLLTRWQALYSWGVPECVAFLFLAALLLAWRGPWGFPAIYAALVFSSAAGRTIVPAGFLLRFFANKAFTANGLLDPLAGVATFNAVVALLVGLAHAVVIELTPPRRRQSPSPPLRGAISDPRTDD